MSLGLIMLFGAIGLNIYSVVWGLVKDRTFHFVSFINIFVWLVLLPVVINYKP